METLSKSFERAKSNMGGLNIYRKMVLWIESRLPLTDWDHLSIAL
jgi:hypothetical protein